jgi:hypothetical protein
MACYRANFAFYQYIHSYWYSFELTTLYIKVGG